MLSPQMTGLGASSSCPPAPLLGPLLCRSRPPHQLCHRCCHYCNWQHGGVACGGAAVATMAVVMQRYHFASSCYPSPTAGCYALLPTLLPLQAVAAAVALLVNNALPD